MVNDIKTLQLQTILSARTSLSPLIHKESNKDNKSNYIENSQNDKIASIRTKSKQ